jgi:hypothetical protein
MTRCDWSRGSSKETIERIFRIKRHGQTKRVQADHSQVAL